MTISRSRRASRGLFKISAYQAFQEEEVPQEYYYEDSPGQEVNYYAPPENYANYMSYSPQERAPAQAPVQQAQQPRTDYENYGVEFTKYLMEQGMPPEQAARKTRQILQSIGVEKTSEEKSDAWNWRDAVIPAAMAGTAFAGLRPLWKSMKPNARAAAILKEQAASGGRLEKEIETALHTFKPFSYSKGANQAQKAKELKKYIAQVKREAGKNPNNPSSIPLQPDTKVNPRVDDPLKRQVIPNETVSEIISRDYQVSPDFGKELDLGLLGWRRYLPKWMPGTAPTKGLDHTVDVTEQGMINRLLRGKSGRLTDLDDIAKKVHEGKELTGRSPEQKLEQINRLREALIVAKPLRAERDYLRTAAQEAAEGGRFSENKLQLGIRGIGLPLGVGAAMEAVGPFVEPKFTGQVSGQNWSGPGQWAMQAGRSGNKLFSPLDPSPLTGQQHARTWGGNLGYGLYDHISQNLPLYGVGLAAALPLAYYASQQPTQREKQLRGLA